MIVEELKNSILESATCGNLTVQNSNEDARVDLKKIILEKQNYLKINKLQDNTKFKVKFPDKKIPSNWVWTSVGELCFVTKLAGFEYTKYMSVNLSTDDEVPVVRAQNIKPNLFIDKCSEYISLELSKQLYRCALDCKCTLMTFIGAGIGETAVFDKNERYHLAPNVAKIVPGLDINKYLMYYFMSPLGKSQVFQYVKQTAQPSLSMETIRSVAVPLPPLDEIKRIVQKIEELFFELDNIEPIEIKLNALKAKFPEDMKKSFLEQIFKGNLVEQSTESAEELLETINNLKEKMINDGKLKKEKALKPIANDEFPYTIPDNWRWVRLGDYCQKVTDQVASGSFKSLRENVPSLKTEDYAIMVKTADFSNNFTKNLTYTTEHAYKFLENSNLFGGELILSNIGSIGKVFIVPKLNHKMTLAPNTVMLKMTDERLIKYLYYFIQSPLGYKELMSISSGTAMLKLNKTDLKTLLIPVPPLEEQIRIVEKIEEILPLIEGIKEMYE